MCTHSSGARCAKADRLTHDEPEIEPTGMNQEAFQNVRVTAQMGTAHAPGVIEMGERVLDHLAASRHRAAVPRSADPPTVLHTTVVIRKYSIRPGILRASRSFV
jgi:hypothetical protein